MWRLASSTCSVWRYSCGPICSSTLRRPRSSQTSSRDDAQTLSRHLSRLWLKIHPDLFSQHPKEQAVNEQSFKALQEALTISETDGIEGGQRPPGRPDFSKGTTLSFYFRGDARQTRLEKTSVTLRHGHLGDALVALFTSLSLEPPPSSVLPESGTAHASRSRYPGRSSRKGNATVTLTSLVQEARMAGMAAMQAKQDGSSDAVSRAAEWAQQDSHMLRLVLQRTRGVSISLGSGLPRRGGNKVGIDRLAAALRRCGDEDLAGLRLVVDGGFDTTLHSLRAQLVLGICTTDARWDGALSSPATRAAAAARRALAARERDAAKALGLAHILFRPHADGGGDVDDDVAQADHAAYTAFLSHACAVDTSPVSAAAATGLSLVLEGAPAAGDRQPGDAVLSADAAEGVLVVDARAPPAAVARAVCEVGVRVAADHAARRAAAAAEDARVRRVARALRVDALRRADGVSDAQWARALGDLLADAGRLGGVLDRSRVAVGARSRLADDGEVVLAWNFRDTLPLA